MATDWRTIAGKFREIEKTDNAIEANLSENGNRIQVQIVSTSLPVTVDRLERLAQQAAEALEIGGWREWYKQLADIHPRLCEDAVTTIGTDEQGGRVRPISFRRLRNVAGISADECERLAQETIAESDSITHPQQLERAQDQAAGIPASGRRDKATNGRTGKAPRKRKESRALIIVRAALDHWHQWGTEDENPNPASQRDLLEKMGLGKSPTNWDPPRLSKAMKLMFPNGGHREYKRLCSVNGLKGFLNCGKDGSMIVDAAV